MNRREMNRGRYRLRVVLILLLISWVALGTAVSAGCDDAPPTDASPADEPRLQAVRFAPGEPVTVDRGVYYLDVDTGAVEGWQLPAGPRVWVAPYPTSPSGRFITYGITPPTGAYVTADRLLDTHTGTVRTLPSGVFRSFAPNDSRYLEATDDGVAILRTEDGAHEHTVPLSHLGYTPHRLGGWAWSPSAEAVLVWWPLAAADGPPLHKLVRLDVASGHVTELADGVLAQGGWSPDGAVLFVLVHGVLEARDATTGQTRWRLTAADLGLSMSLKDGVEPLGAMTVPFYAPGGRRAVVLAAGGGSDEGYRAAVIDPASGAVQFWVANVLSCGQRWSADGAWLHVVGERDGQAGSFLVSVGGAEVRPLGRFVMDLSPHDPRLGVYLAIGPGEPAIAALDLLTGASRPLASIQGATGAGIRSTRHCGWPMAARSCTRRTPATAAAGSPNHRVTSPSMVPPGGPNHPARSLASPPW